MTSLTSTTGGMFKLMENSCSETAKRGQMGWHGPLDVVTELYSYELDEVNRTIIVRNNTGDCCSSLLQNLALSRTILHEAGPLGCC